MLSMALKFCSSPMMGNLAASSCRMPRVSQRALVVMATAKDPTISQSNFVKKFAQKHGLDEKSARAAVKGVLDMITDEVAEGNKVTFLGFGAFSPKHRPARKARNPKTQEELDVPASTVPHFSASKTFKEKVGQGHNGAA